MMGASHFAFAMLLCCCTFASAQTAPASTDQKPAANTSKREQPNPRLDSAPGQEPCPETKGGDNSRNIEILSDTMGVDFGPYLERVLHDVRLHWYLLIPDVAKPPLIRKGKVCIEFAILKDGKVAGMKWTQPSGDGSLDRAAWGGVASSNPFAPLPAEFRGKYLRLNFHFYYNPGEINIWPSGAVIYEGRFRIVRAAAGRSQKFSVGAHKGESKDSASATMEKVMNDAAMNWTVVGSGCEGELCGTISSEGVYTAPILIPNPPSVAVTVALQSDPSKTDSVSVEIVEGSAH